MSLIKFNISTDIIIGNYELKNLKSHIDDFCSKKTLIILDNALENSDYIQDVINNLKIKNKTISIYINNSKREPTYDHLEKVRFDVNSLGVDLIVAIGGGSTMDLGKGIAILLRNNYSALELKGFPKNIIDPLPLITVPTVFGSGSEVSFNAVFIDEKEGKKLGINSRKNFPKKTIIDPIVTMTAPLNIVINSAFDTLVHCVDSYGSKKANKLSRMLSINGFSSTLNCLLNKNLSIPENRIDLAIGSICGIFALMNSGDGPTNGFAYYFGVKDNIPHGLAGAIFMKDVMKWNYKNGYKDYDKIINFNHSKENNFLLIDEVYKKFEIPKLAKYGYEKKHIDNLALEVSRSLMGSFEGNPIIFDLNSAKDILNEQIE